MRQWILRIFFSEYLLKTKNWCYQLIDYSFWTKKVYILKIKWWLICYVILVINYLFLFRESVPVCYEKSPKEFPNIIIEFILTCKTKKNVDLNFNKKILKLKIECNFFLICFCLSKFCVFYYIFFWHEWKYVDLWHEQIWSFFKHWRI